MARCLPLPSGFWRLLLPFVVTDFDRDFRRAGADLLKNESRVAGAALRLLVDAFDDDEVAVLALKLVSGCAFF
jgi:hypothetical protein